MLDQATSSQNHLVTAESNQFLENRTYALILRSCPEQLKLGVGGARCAMRDARCVDKQLATKRKGIELVRNAQTFKLERGVNGHENMVALVRSVRVRDLARFALDFKDL